MKTETDKDIFPAFKSLKAIINFRSLYLHVRQVMTALENAVFSRRKGFHRVFNESWRKT